YVIRPGHAITIKDGLLRLSPRLEPRALFRPVDDFFKSLAEEQRERAIGIIMSGMGSNGTAGAQAIKAVGGLCIAQDPESAEFPSMPRHLIDQGYADYILPTKEMPEVLLAYIEHPYAKDNRAANEGTLPREQQHLREILAILRTRTKQDFSGYKKPTILRRVQRRMGLSRLENIHDYAKLLRQSPSEVTALADDLLIHVTGFFRDPEAWEALRQQIIVPLVAAREPDSTVRCWVAACSSGEEAYTLAILLTEEANRTDKRLDIKVFATDMADRALSHARAGLYPGGIESEMSAERLDQFFERDDGLYRIKQELRESVVFAAQNVLQDPPFSRIDIASCRNLLIYLEPQVQQRVLGLLHFGIREGGALFLGSSETIAGAEDFFEVVDKRAKIFRRVGATRHGLIDFNLPAQVGRLSPGEKNKRSGSAPLEAAQAIALQHRAARLNVANLTQRTLIEFHTPPAVTIDHDFRVIFFHGNTRPFLDQPSGEPTRDLLLLTRDSLRSAVRLAVQRAMAESTTVTVPDGWIETAPGQRVHIAVQASPLADKGGPDYFVISFQERSDVKPTDDQGATNDDAEQSTEELRRVRDELRSANEELQTTNEELRASHEEVMSMNEELQSTNEELETSKEEMQSLNEELATVNSQLRSKMEEWQSASNDLASLLNSADLAVLFLDNNFRIRRYTPAARELIEMIASDVGRPLSDLARKFTDPHLLTDAEKVLQTLRPIEREVSATNDRWFQRRITPYRTIDNHIEGIVVSFFDTTDRHRIQAIANATQARLERMVNIEGVGILTFDRSGTLLDANDAFLKVTGYSRGDVLSQKLTWRDLTPPEHLPLSEQQMLKLHDSGRIGPYEKEYILKNGRRKWMLFAGATFGSDQILEYCIDIDDRKRAQIERDRFFSLSQDLLAIASFREGHFQRVNPAMARALGWSEEELLAMPFQDLVHPDDRQRSAEQIAALAEGKSINGFEQRLRCKNGEYRWIEWQSLGEAASGLIYCAGRDITERRGMELTIRHSEEQSRLLIEGVGDFAMLMTDPAGRIVSWNTGAQRLLGFTEAEAIGQPIAVIFTPEDRAAGVPEGELSRAAESGKSPDERWHMRTDGTRFWGSGVTTAVRDPDGTLRGFVKVMRDDTARKKAEEGLQSAKDAAELASRAKDEFLAMLSHELRTPLSSILIWSKMLRGRQDAPPEYAEAIDAITRSADAQKQLIDDLLDTSRITAGKLRLEMRQINLASVIPTAMESVLPTAEAKGITVNVDLAKDVGVVKADPDRLRQIIWNLLNNAIKFTPAGGRIDVGLSRRGRFVEVRVADTGKGIDPSFLPHVFEPFRQAEGSMTRVYGGLGLGLAICKQLVEQHGGTITAESAGQDKGAVFTVRLPLPPVRAASSTTRKSGGNAASSTEQPALPQVHVLLVEDEAETRKAMTQLLRRSGAVVTAVTSAAPAFETFERSRPDLLVIDIGLPDEDGYSLIRRIRALEAGVARVPAVAVTAFARPDDRAQALSAGFDQHIGKPVEPRALVSALA
ncbi:MAG: PAS domain S-box protein, partial [Phycisphaerae bacterium]|nr:PAS domain S-box protein [Phycisphaerae bacterium]